MSEIVETRPFNPLTDRIENDEQMTAVTALAEQLTQKAKNYLTELTELGYDYDTALKRSNDFRTDAAECIGRIGVYVRSKRFHSSDQFTSYEDLTISLHAALEQQGLPFKWQDQSGRQLDTSRDVPFGVLRDALRLVGREIDHIALRPLSDKQSRQPPTYARHRAHR